MPDPMLMGKALVAAGAIAIVLTLLAGKAARGWVASMATLLALIGSVVVGLWILGLVPQWPPREAFDRLLIVILPAAAAAELFANFFPRVAWIARGVVAMFVAPVLVAGSSYVSDLAGPDTREWSPAATWGIYAALGLTLLVVWAAMIYLVRRTRERTPLVCLAVAALAAGPIVIFSGYATGGQMGVPLAAALAGVALGSLVWRQHSQIEGALGIGIVSLFSLLVIARLFAGLTDLNAGLVFAAPLLGWVPELLPSRIRWRSALRLALTAIPLALALFLAQRQFRADSERSGSSGAGSLDDYMNFGK